MTAAWYLAYVYDIFMNVRVPDVPHRARIVRIGTRHSPFSYIAISGKSGKGRIPAMVRGRVYVVDAATTDSF